MGHYLYLYIFAFSVKILRKQICITIAACMIWTHVHWVQKQPRYCATVQIFAIFNIPN